MSEKGFIIDNGRLEKYTGKRKEVIIPEGVVEIGKHAFSYCDFLTSVTLPNSVIKIEEEAFYSCHELTNINIPSSVTSIGDNAIDVSNRVKCNIKDGLKYLGSDDNPFLYLIGAKKKIEKFEIDSACKFIGRVGNSELVSIDIPESVIGIDSGAFFNCTHLESIVVNENNNVYKSIDGVLYTKDETKLVAYPVAKKEKSFTIPQKVTNIGNYAFNECKTLEDIIMFNDVISIGKQSFAACTSLKNVQMSSNIRSVGEWAFADCKALPECFREQWDDDYNEY